MPDKWAKYIVPGPEAQTPQAEAKSDRWSKYAVTKGSDPFFPLQERHPEVPQDVRLALNSVVTPEAGIDFLKKNYGLEAVATGNNGYSVRRPSEAQWRVVDPDEFSWDEIWRDAVDLFPYAVRGAGQVVGAGYGAAKGAIIGAPLAPATGPIGPAATAVGFGIAGGAAGGAAAEGALQLAAKARGFDVSDAGSAIGREAITGGATALIPGAGQVAGRVAAKALPTGLKTVGKVAGNVVGGAGVGAGMAATQAGILEGRLPTEEELASGAAFGVAGQALGAGLPLVARKLIGRGTPQSPGGPDLNVVQRVGAALEKPLAIEQAKGRLGQEVTAEQAARAAVREAELRVAPQKDLARQAQVEEAVARSGLTRLVQDPELERYKANLLAARSQEAARRAEAAGVAGAEEMAPLKSDLLSARADEAAARLETAEAVRENRQALMARFDQAAKTAEESTLRGQKIALNMFPEGPPVTIKQTTKYTTKEPGKPRLNIPSIVARPDTGFTAEALESNPEIGSLLRKALGPEFVPEYAEGGKRGSFSMKNREARLKQLVEEKGDEWAEQAGTQLAKDLAGYLLDNPALTRDLDRAALEAIGQTAAGRVTRESATTTIRALETKIRGRAVSERLATAKDELEQAVIERLRANKEKLAGQVDLDPDATAAGLALKQAALERLQANAELQGARTRILPKLQEAQKGLAGARAKRTEAGAGLLSARETAVMPAKRALEEQVARTAQARAAYSALNPNAPYANFGQQWLSTGRLAPASLGFTAGTYAAGIPGGVIGGALGAIASEPARQVSRRFMAMVGRGLMKADGSMLRAIKNKVPEPFRPLVDNAYELAVAGNAKFRVLVNALLSNEAFKQWAASEEGQKAFPEVSQSPAQDASEVSRRITTNPTMMMEEALRDDMPPEVREQALMAVKASERGPSAFKAAASIALSSPAFRAWTSGMATPERGASLEVASPAVA